MIQEITTFIKNKTGGLVIDTNLFSGHRPLGVTGDCDVVLESGGGAVYFDLPERADPVIQVLSRALTYMTARARAWAIYNAIFANYVETGSAGWTLPIVTAGEEYEAMIIEPLAIPQYVGQDKKLRHEFSCNYIFKIVPLGSPIIQLSNNQTPLNTTDVWLAISSGSCTIDWGDGETTTATGAVVTKYSHNYAAAGTGTYNIVIYGNTKNITDFRCFNEPISGDIAQFRRLTNLTELYLYTTSISGNISSLSGLTSLTIIDLSTTSISGNISNLSGLTSLTWLELWSTSISGNISSLSGLTSLTYLDIDDTSISGNISSLSGLTSLTLLALQDTSVSGDITNLSGLPSLTELYLYSTSVSGDIASISGLTSLEYVDLYSTSIDTYTQGTLPDWEGTAINIQDLGLDQTEVSDFLVDLDNATGSPGNGTLNISGTNAIPNAAGLTAKGNLEGKGWTITVST